MKYIPIGVTKAFLEMKVVTMTTTQLLLRKLSAWPIPDWMQLRMLGQNRALKSSYFWFVFVPIAARLISQLNQPLSISVFGQVHLIHLSLPFSWYQFFFAAVFFSAANLVFALRCPSINQEYASPQESYDAGNGAVYVQNQLIALPGYVFFEKFQSNLFYAFRAAEAASPDSAHAANAWLDDHGSEATPNPFEVSDLISSYICIVRREVMNDLFALIHKAHAISRPVARLFASTCYLIGFILLGFILAANVRFVIRSFFEN
ncbi:MAG: hypothetical protein U0984_13905 [Prosthecobacter sp.]|nr:hypothetical protein [Prosthecobacter sp.]